MFRLILIATFALLAGFAPAHAENSPRVIVHLLDYLSQDYGGAVSGGKVIDKGEYEEQVEFSQSAVEVAKSLDQIKGNKEINGGLASLKKLVMQKAPSTEVAKLAQQIKLEVISATGLEVSPVQWPDLKRGRELFRQNCITCHGEKGDGKGPAAAGLNPQPSNFLDAQRMGELSPFQAFNTIRVGLPGTAMAAWPAFTDKDVWSLAFYLVSLRHQGALSSKNTDEVEQLVDE
jgi:high-affinity iron transporter